MANDLGWSWCPECKKWVPMTDMNYDGSTRVCTHCLEGTSQDNNFVVDESFGKVQCIWCRSTDTVELAPDWRKFQCNTCGKSFKVL